MKSIDTSEDLARGLDELLALDPRLAPVCEGTTPLPLRRSEPGFASLVSIVVSQQISRQSAMAIMGRLEALIVPLSASELLRSGEPALVAAGLSRPKQRTLASLAEAVASGAVDLVGIVEHPADRAIARLTALHGIGPWTAEVYLLFCAGHPDIFPAHDVALQAAVADGLGLAERPDARTLYRLAESWAPWRGVAARLFWAHYALMRGRDVLPSDTNTKSAMKSG